MAVDRLLPDQDAADLIALTRDIADRLLTPIVDGHERTETYPEGVFAQLGDAGLRSLPQPEEWGGGGGRGAGSKYRATMRSSALFSG